LTITPIANAFGTTTIAVRVEDEAGLSTQQTFVVTVTAVNDVPTITGMPNQAAAEDGPPLLANAGTEDAGVTITFLRETGAPIVKTFTVPASSRFNVTVSGPGSDVPELAEESFGARIDATRPIVVERSVYSNANGVTWAAGTNATATPLP
jgi:hypothetical protein